MKNIPKRFNCGVSVDDGYHQIFNWYMKEDLPIVLHKIIKKK